MSTLETLDSPVRSFFQRLEPLAASPAPDMDAIANLLLELAGDADYFEHHIAAMPTDRASTRPLHMPQDGPRLILVHRPEGVMGPVHSHQVWVAIAPISGTETHRRYDVKERRPDGTAELTLAEELHLRAGSGEAATLTPPNDVHAHGHAAGIGQAAYILVLTGDNQLKYERQEYDLESHTWRTLAPGDLGRF
jgi:predicted metal-dependent enzyme (double-stranded beta helix superfamily)